MSLDGDCTYVPEKHYFIYKHGRAAFSWQKATPVIVGWFADRTWKNNCKWDT